MYADVSVQGHVHDTITQLTFFNAPWYVYKCWAGLVYLESGSRWKDLKDLKDG